MPNRLLGSGDLAPEGRPRHRLDLRRGMMMKGRKIGTIAALATTTATVAMLSGLSAARADELQVNQQLLDQRVDQLAAGQFSGPSVIGTTDVNPNAGAPVT